MKNSVKYSQREMRLTQSLSQGEGISLNVAACNVGILQVGSVNDISQSSHSLGHTGRLLRLRLTDGHLWLTAVEYHPIPSLSVDIPPGTKVRLLSTNS